MMEFIKKNPPRFVFLTGLFLIILVFGGIITYTALRDTVATVGSTEITKQDLSDRIYYSTGKEQSINFFKKDVTAQEYLTQLVEEETIRQKMAENNIIITNEEATESLVSRIPDYSDRSERFKNLAIEAEKVNLGKAKLEEKIVGWAEGEYLVYRAAQYLEVSTNDSLDNPQTKIDEGKYETERAYAEKLAKRHLSEIKNGTKTFSEVKDELLKDGVIGEDAYNQNYISPVGVINQQNYASSYYFFGIQSFRDTLRSLDEGETSDLVSIEVYPNGKEDNSKVGYYILINIQKKVGGEYPSLKEWLENNKTNTKIYY